MKDQVRRMAENDEPKCGNCKYWLKDYPHGFSIKPCSLNGKVVQTGGTSVLSGASSSYEVELRHTTDLSLCSQWESR